MGEGLVVHDIGPIPKEREVDMSLNREFCEWEWRGLELPYDVLFLIMLSDRLCLLYTELRG